MPDDKSYEFFKAEFMGDNNFMKLAKTTKDIYDAFVGCGFPDDRAYEIAKTLIFYMISSEQKKKG